MVYTRWGLLLLLLLHACTHAYSVQSIYGSARAGDAQRECWYTGWLAGHRERLIASSRGLPSAGFQLGARWPLPHRLETRPFETREPLARPSPAPVSSHLPKHHRIVQLVESSARALRLHTAAHGLTLPHRTNLCHRLVQDPPSSDGRPSLSTSHLCCSPISDTLAAACPSLVSFPAACFALHIPLPSRATWLSYPLQYYALAAHQTLPV